MEKLVDLFKRNEGIVEEGGVSFGDIDPYESMGEVTRQTGVVRWLKLVKGRLVACSHRIAARKPYYIKDLNDMMNMKDRMVSHWEKEIRWKLDHINNKQGDIDALQQELTDFKVGNTVFKVMWDI